ncbi:hypothetical protein BH24ACT15_BH24ACT15_02390 [soil metagenome]
MGCFVTSPALRWLPGSVAAVHVAEGAWVKSGNVLLVLEAMKMEHPILAPHDGTVARLLVSHNDQVQAGDVLAVIIPGDAGREGQGMSS